MYNAATKSADDNDPLSPYQRPRGYGGVAILWEKSLPVIAHPDGSERIQVIQVGHNINIINAYMPCRGSYSNDEFCEEMDKLDEVCSKFNQHQTILTGDLNVDLMRHSGTRVKYLNSLLEKHHLSELHSSTAPTYIHTNGVSKVDYILASQPLPKGSKYCMLEESATNSSPHAALMLTIAQIQLDTIWEKPKNIKTRQWDKVDALLYQETVELHLHDHPEVVDADSAITFLTNTLKSATEKAVPLKIIRPNSKPKPFNDCIGGLLKESKNADAVWKENGKQPSPDPNFIRRVRVRKALKNAQTVETARHRENEVDEIMRARENDQELFYKLIRRQRKLPNVTPSELNVNGVIHKENLIDAWTEHFSKLAIPSDNPHFDDSYLTQVTEDIEKIHTICDNLAPHLPITKFEVNKAVSQLKNKKAKDENGLIAENLKLAGPHLISFLTSLINCIIKSSKIPNAFKGGILHPIHKKGKNHLISGNYRGITIINLIGKVLDTIQLHHQEAAIPPNKRDTQFSFTKGRSATQATIILSELLAEAKDEKKPLLVASLDIEKAFDVISHPHLLRKLFLAGLPGRWWQLKEDMYTGMSSKVVWENEIGRSYPNKQGNRQGARGSPGDFKEYTDDHINTLKEKDLGTHIGPIYTGTLACADDVVLTTHSILQMKILLGLMAELNNRDRLKIHPLKTSISIFNLPKPLVEHLSEQSPWAVNGEPTPVRPEFTHLGINFDLSSYNATASATVDSRLKMGRSTTYSLMGTGLHGDNGLHIKASLHVYNTYVLPKMLYGLEAIELNPPNLRRLETGHRSLLRDIQGLPKRTATSGVYILSGALPMEALIDRRRLCMLPSLKDNPTLRHIVHRQISMKPSSSSSWVVATQDILRKYELPHISKVIEGQPTKTAWKAQVDKAIHEHWRQQIVEEAENKSTLKHLCKEFTPNQPHLLWQATTNTVRDVRRGTIKGRMLTGTYILQSTRAAFNQTKITLCQMCKQEDEDMEHFIFRCPTLSSARDHLLKILLMSVPYVYTLHPSIDWKHEDLLQLIMDSTHPTIVALLPMTTDLKLILEKHSRILCYSLHRARCKALEKI